MPTLENQLPNLDRRSLVRREARAGHILAIARATEPAAMILSCRHEWKAMAELARNEALDVADRVAALGGAVKVRDQMMDLLCMPRRPIAASKPTRQADLSAMVAFDLPEMPVAPAQDSPNP